jgi:hypothetical protein
MRNCYYYSFFLLATFSKKVNKNNSEYAFSGMTYLSLLMSFNIFTLLSILELSLNIKFNGSLLYIATGLCIIGINYYLLIANDKSVAILNFYKKNWNVHQNKQALVAFIVYVVVSIVLCVYSAYLIRNTKN